MEGDLMVTTLVFNTFVFAQIFNSVNCRRLDNKLNIFEGIFRNRFFILITLIGTSVACAPKRFDTNNGFQRLVFRSLSCSSTVAPSKSLTFPVESGVSHSHPTPCPSHSVFSSDTFLLHHLSAPSSS